MHVRDWTFYVCVWPFTKCFRMICQKIKLAMNQEGTIATTKIGIVAHIVFIILIKFKVIIEIILPHFGCMTILYFSDALHALKI